MASTVTWSVFQNFVDTRNLSIQWINADGNYYLKAFDGLFQLDCILNQTLNQIETVQFQTFYQANGNKLVNFTEVSSFVRAGKMFSLSTGTFLCAYISETPILLLSNPASNQKAVKLFKTYLTAPVANGALAGSGGNDNIYNFYLNPSVSVSSKPINIIGNRQSNQNVTQLKAFAIPVTINMGSLFYSISMIANGVVTHDFATWLDPGNSLLVTVKPSNANNKAGASLEFAEE